MAYVLSNVSKLYDGSSGDSSAVQTGVDIVVRDERIDRVVPHGTESFPSDISAIDCSSYTITPGLVDCHGHITILGVAESDEDTMSSEGALLWVEKILYTTLVDGGVTTMRDVGGANLFMKRMVAEGIVIGPRLKIAICMLSTTGGHADLRGPDRCHSELLRQWGEGPGRPSSIVDGPWECRKRIREIAACGADLIKLCTSPGVASPSDKLEHREFTAEEVHAICNEAHARGLSVAAHAHTKSGIRLAIENGVHDIQHISFMDEELVDLASHHGCVVTPTSWVVYQIGIEPTLPAPVHEKAQQIQEVHTRATQYAASGGLPILAGTDPVLKGMHGRNYMEIAHLIKDGLSPLAAWYASTGLAAAEIGQEDAGTVEAGRRADLLVCSSDVLQTPEALRDVLVEVIKDGVGYRNGLATIPQRTFNTDTVAHMAGLATD